MSKFDFEKMDENDLYNTDELFDSNFEKIEKALFPMWVGTQEEYDLIIPHDPMTLYIAKLENGTANLYFGDIPITGGGVQGYGLIGGSMTINTVGGFGFGGVMEKKEDE